MYIYMCIYTTYIYIYLSIYYIVLHITDTHLYRIYTRKNRIFPYTIELDSNTHSEIKQDALMLLMESNGSKFGAHPRVSEVLSQPRTR